MIFSNINNLTLTIFILILFLWAYFLYRIYKKNNNKISNFLLFFSLFFILINIFEIKWWLKSKVENIEWWKIVFVLDISKSMNSIDWINNNVSISRLELWKKIVDSYISENLNNNYWLIIFAWESLEVIPFTNDFSIFKTILYSINNTSISKNWTNLNTVFDSLNNFFIGDKEWWLVVILTDWWDEKIDISNEKLKKIIDKWVKISIVWIGSENWAKIPIWNDLSWKIIYKTFKWQDVVTKLNKQELESVSNEHHFEYTDISNFDNFSKINEFITKNINLLSMKKNIDYRTDYTRLFILISFIFFILFLIFDNFIWIKK